MWQNWKPWRSACRRVRHDLCALPRLFGGVEVLDEAQRILQPSDALHAALQGLRWLASHASGLQVSIDLADLRGYAYYTGHALRLVCP